MKTKGKIITACVFAVGVILTGVGTGVAVAEYSGFKLTDVKKYENIVTETFDYDIAGADGRGVILDDNYFFAEKKSFAEDESVPEGVIRYEISYNSDLVTPSVKFEDIDSYVADDYRYSWEYYYELDEYQDAYPDDYYGDYDDDYYYDHDDYYDHDGYGVYEHDGDYHNAYAAGKMTPGERREAARAEAEQAREQARNDYSGAISIELDYKENYTDVTSRYKDIFLEGLKNRELLTGGPDYVTEIVVRINPATAGLVENRQI